MADEPEPLFLRVPPNLKSKLRVHAARKGISMTADAIVLLEDALRWAEVERVVAADPQHIP